MSCQCGGCGAYLAYSYGGEESIIVDTCNRCVESAVTQLERQLSQQADKIASLELSLQSFEQHHEAQTKEWEEREAQQAELIGRALEVVEVLAWAGCYCSSERKFPIYPGENNHKEECLVGRAQALIQDLEKTRRK